MRPGGLVGTFLKWAAVPTLILAGVTVALVAGRGESPVMAADLASDLDLVAASQLELAPGGGAGATVVSAAEQIDRPAPRRTPTPTRNRGAEAPPPQVVAVSDAGEEGAAVGETVVPAVATPDAELAIPSPEAIAPPAVPRPRPVEPRFPVGTEPAIGSGDRGGGGIGTVVIRGGRTGRDDCAIHDRRRGAGGPGGIHIAINQRIPVTTTFPRR